MGGKFNAPSFEICIYFITRVHRFLGSGCLRCLRTLRLIDGSKTFVAPVFDVTTFAVKRPFGIWCTGHDATCGDHICDATCGRDSVVLV